MHPRDFYNIDDFIDAALRSESMRGVPLGFHRRVEDRLRMSALLRRERSRFRRILTVSGVVFFSGLSAITLAALLGDIPGGLTGSVPGALGYYDQFIAMLSVYWPHVVATALVSAGAIVAGLLLFDVLPHRRTSTQLGPPV